MRLERWWSVILAMGLFMGLSPMNAQAGPNRNFAPQPNRQACTRPQPRAFAPQVNRQVFNRPQPRAFANGWNSQPHQWQQPRGQACGWNGQNRQWQQPRGNDRGWNGQQPQWDHRNAYGRNDHQWQQPPNWGQHNNPGSSYNRAGYPTHPQSPNIAPRSSGYSHNNTIPAGQTGAQPLSQPDASGNAPLLRGNSL